MNILLVTPWDQEFGGVASVVGHLAKYLQSRRHTVIFLHPEDSDRLERKTTQWGFPGYRLNLRPPVLEEHPVRSRVAFLAFFIKTMYHLLRVIQRHHIKVVNIHYPTDQFIYFALCSRLLPITLVVSIHGADLFPDGRPMRRYSSALRFLLSSAHAIVAPSQAFLADCLTRFPHLAPKATFIHNGIDIRELASDNGEGLMPDGRYLLCIAASNEKKALDVLLRAFTLVKDADEAIRLVLVGDGPLRRQHEDLARALALDGRVEFLGWKGRSEVARLLRGCELFVLPSRSEPFGIAIIEAMACRKPVVASAVGGIPEIIEDGQNGILVQPDNPPALANTVLALLRDHARLRLIADNGHARVLDRFRYEHMGAAYERMFSALLKGSGSWARHNLEGKARLA